VLVIAEVELKNMTLVVFAAAGARVELVVFCASVELAVSTGA